MPAFDLLTGSAETREAIAGGANPADVTQLVAPVDASWKQVVLDAEARVVGARA